VPSCIPSSKTETTCTDNVDDDCDGFVDCLDPDCDTKSCGASGASCVAGACIQQGSLPALPRIDNIVPTVRGDTATIEFSAVMDAKDYRIYPMPDKSDISVSQNGEVTVHNAIYRCGGALPRDDRSMDQVNRLSSSLAANVEGYTRKESESLLGHGYLSPGAGRLPIYRVSNPNLVGGYPWEYQAPPAKEYNGADYVQGTQARDALLAKGWRDDGIAFYVSDSGTRSVYRREYADNGTSVFYTTGPEKTARDSQSGAPGSERFKILETAGDGTVPIYRIFYSYNNDHDVLAAGDANRERVLHQGNMPSTALSWPGLKGETTLVIEALDAGCPFPGGYIGAAAAPAADLDGVASLPTITLDKARLPSGEVFVNGQYDAANRPKPIARAYVTVQPKPQPDMDWFESFDPDATPQPFDTVVNDNIGTRVFRNDKLSVEFQASNANYSYGPMLGQFVAGSVSTFGMAALGANARIADDSYLHVTMAADLDSTNRRYPQIFITDVPLGDPKRDAPSSVPFVPRLGPLPFQKLPPGQNHTIIVQTFGGQPELQIQFCDLRGWGVSQQCPKANIYGFHVGSTDVDWTAPWLPIPVLGEYAGIDRLVKFDVYASTKRVYVFIEDHPAGCAVIPEGRFPAGQVNVVFGAAAYHIEVDEFLTRPPARIQYWAQYSLAHSDRKFDDLGVKSKVSLPAWDESIMPCGTRYYAGSQ
jgi:hypothetical protein